MSNSAHITSDLKYAVVNDASDGGKISIGKRGVLLSVLGNEMVGSEVTSELDKTVNAKIRGKKPFFEFEVKDLEKNHLCVSYQEQSNILYLIGITDVFIGFAIPEEIKPNHLKAVGIKLKKSPSDGLSSRHIVLIRLEGKIGKQKTIAFYNIEDS